MTVHAAPLWHFALDCGLTPDQAEDACELAWLRAAQSLEERPHVGQGFGHGLRATVVDEAHQTRTPKGYHDHRPRLDLVGASSASAARPRPGGDVSDRQQNTGSEQRLGVERRRQPRRGADDPSPPYFQAFDRIATALEGIEEAIVSRGSIVLPDAGALQESHPRP